MVLCVPSKIINAKQPELTINEKNALCERIFNYFKKASLLDAYSGNTVLMQNNEVIAYTPTEKFKTSILPFGNFTSSEKGYFIGKIE
jgi:hypothetical protein